MVTPAEYFYYLKRALRGFHIHGYRIDLKKDRKTCIYSEHGKWVVARVEKGEAVDPSEYEPDDIWHACEDLINRLVEDEEQRKKVWMAWASPTNWAEKMAEPLKAFPVQKKD